MPRKTLRMLLMAIVAVLALGSFAEAAAAKRVVRHRAKHSTRVSAHGGPTKARKAVARRHKNKKKITAAKKTSVKAKQKPATKPR